MTGREYVWMAGGHLGVSRSCKSCFTQGTGVANTAAVLNSPQYLAQRRGNKSETEAASEMKHVTYRTLKALDFSWFHLSLDPQQNCTEKDLVPPRNPSISPSKSARRKLLAASPRDTSHTAIARYDPPKPFSKLPHLTSILQSEIDISLVAALCISHQ